MSAPDTAASPTSPHSQESARKTTGQAIIDGLIAHGVDTVFGIPGVQTYGLFDGLAQRPDDITVYGARHEQGAAWMAYGYAQATGRPGVFSVVPGPGVLNAGAALLSGYGASQPMVCLTSEIPTAFMGRGLGHLHEMPDQLATLRTFTKWSENCLHPAHASGLVAEAMYQATSGRPRPVALAAPWDTLTKTAEIAACTPRTITPPAPDAQFVARAIELLANASNPMILVGGGALDAADEVLELARLLQAPVVSFRGGRGVVSSEDPLGFNCAEGFTRWADTDVVIGIGCRMELAWFRWGPRPAGQSTILIDIDPQQHTRLAPTVSLVTTARAGAAALSFALNADAHITPDRTEEFAAAKARRRNDIATRLQPHLDYFTEIRAAMTRDGVLVEEVCQMGFASYFAFDVYSPRTFISGGHQGSLGLGYPTSLGVKAARPERPVISINGDGGFMFGVQEIATAVQYSLPVVAIVFDNESFGNVLNDQRRLFDGRILGSELRNPDFVALARSFGARGQRVDDGPAALGRAVRDAIESNEPTVIHVPMPLDPAVTPWPFLMPS